MDAALRFRVGDALHTMNTAFIFQLGINFLALNSRDNFFYSTHLRRRAFHHFDFPALGFGVTRIHAEEVACEDAGFVAASAGADFKDNVFVVDRIVGEEKKFQLALGLFFADGKELFFFLGHVAHFSVTGLDHHLASGGEVFFHLLELAVLVDDRFEIGVLLGEFLETRGISDDLGSGEFLGHFLVAGVELIEFFR